MPRAEEQLQLGIRGLFFGSLSFVVLTFAISARADVYRFPSTYKQSTPGNKFVFVMISPLAIEENERGLQEQAATGLREIRRAYTRSGMYLNDRSVEPLWTIDWYARDVELASDGVHLIRQVPWAVLPEDTKAALGSALDQEAMSFFANGQLVRTYRIGELVDDVDQLKRSSNHFQWRKDGKLNDDRMEYTLRTLDGNKFVFDVRTGAIVSESRPGRLSSWTWKFALGAVIVVAISFVIWMRRRRARLVSS